jgi:hypothetical protein
MSIIVAEQAKQREAISREEDMLKKIGIEKIPFRTRLSFQPLIQRIELNVASNDFAESFLAKSILERLEKAPAMREPIDDPGLLEKHRDLLQLMMLELFPTAMRKVQLSKISAPFEMAPVYMTPAFEEMWCNDQVDYTVSKSANLINCTTVVRACSFILNRFYGQNISVDPTIIVTVQKKGSNFPKHFKTVMNLEFMEVKKLKPLKKLSQDQINRLLSNIYDVDLWMEHIPPENFEFQGFTIADLVDITEEEALSRVKFALLEKDAVLCPDTIAHIQQLLRTYFGIEELQMGVTAIDYPCEHAVSHRYKIRFDFLADRQKALLAPENKNSIYEKVCKFKEVLLAEDLQELDVKTPIERDLIKKGIRSIIVAPLSNKNGDVIGLLEIGSPHPYQLHSFTELKFKEITGLFCMAVERSREEIDNRIEATLREQFTAVHPSVEWKFIEASYNLMENRENNIHATVEPIVFHNVYPMYGQADIVSSSIKRNNAIQADLIDNLQRAQKVLEKNLKQLQFPLAGQMMMKVGQGIAQLENEFNSSDESRIIAMLHEEVHPLFRHMQDTFPDMAFAITGYFDSLDPELGIIHHKRKAYEDSVALVNHTIASFLEEEEKEAQNILPHYFEKYKTDGVEYDIYVGQSLLNQHRFSMMHLRNFRLWQLIHMCRVTRKVRELQDRLPVPLETAQLIFAYTTPLSIRFRMDEKRFEVDGAYNVRYEILKKRIDKAVVEGTSERLTLAGKIAVVYLQEKDRQEYFEYFDYLRYEGLITGEVEDLKLGKLQGVQGLRALRVTVGND